MLLCKARPAKIAIREVSFMDFNKIKEMGLEYAEKGKNAAMDLAERGKTQAKIVNEQTKLARAQRQLGALVYSLAKGNEENQPLVDKYIEMIDAIEKNLAALRESIGTPWRQYMLTCSIQRTHWYVPRSCAEPMPLPLHCLAT